MSLYCSTPLPAFSQDICANEPGRVIAVALMRSDHAVTDPTSFAQWNTARSNSTAVIIQNVRGEKPKSSPVNVDGFGKQQSRSVSRDFTAQYFHPDVVGNEDFYNILNFDNAHSFWYYTQGGLIWTTGTAIADFNADHIVEAGLNTSIIFDVEVAWSSNDIPIAYTAPAGIFE